MNYSRYADNIKRAIDFIEKNLKSNVSYSDAAAAAGMSKDNFWRVFKMIFRETIGSYIRARKLTVMAARLLGSGRAISDLAYEYNYESPEILTRAFKRRFGVTPVEYRRRGKSQFFLERQRLTEEAIRHILSGGITSSPEPVRIRAFYIIGRESYVRAENSGRVKSGLWKRFISGRGRFSAAGSSRMYRHICPEKNRRNGFLPYSGSMKAVVGGASGCPEMGKARARVPSGKYLRFVHRGGPEKLHLSYCHIIAVHVKRIDRRFFFFDVMEKNFGTGGVRTEIYLPAACAKHKEGRK